jgi:hypothetical protein
MRNGFLHDGWWRAVWIGSLAFGLAAWAGLDAAPAETSPVEVQVIRYKALGDAIKQSRGKIIVVDFWSDT